MFDYAAIAVDSPVELRIQGILFENGLLSLGLKNPGNVSVLLYDASGRMVKRIFSGPLPPGNYDIPFDTYKLSDGAYFMKVTCGDRTFVKKLVKLN